MNTRFVSMLIFFTLVFGYWGTGLSAEVEGERPPEANRMKPDHAPTPFSAAEFRDSFYNGLRFKYQIQTTDEPDIFAVVTFWNWSEEGVSIEAVRFDSEGKQVGEKKNTRVKWKEFQKQLSFPEANTKITSETISTPAGTFECWLYEVTSGGKKVERLWFTKTMPGLPVYSEDKVAGQLMSKATLME